MITRTIHPRVTLSLREGLVHLEYAVRRCTTCTLSDAFPEIAFDAEGRCSYCALALGEEAELAFDPSAFVRSAPGREYDCLVLYSGGKDSTMALLAITEEVGLRPLAFTLDNGYLAAAAFANIRHVVSRLGVDHVQVRPGVMPSVYRASFRARYDASTLRYSTAGCGSCIALVLALGARTAAAHGIPLMSGGWTPGQLTTRSRLPGAFLEDVVRGNLTPLRGASRELEERLHRYDPSSIGCFPDLYNPLAGRRYDEAKLLERIEALGWVRPEGVDSCSTNCRLNGLLVVDHILKHGYHPYEYELAHHVRIGCMSREQAIRRVEEIGVTRGALEALAKSLDWEVPWS